MTQRIVISCEDISGWLTALYLLHNTDSKITLIQKEFKTIGEVESIHPYVVKFLFDSGLTLDDWMSNSSATFRYGIGLDKWTHHMQEKTPNVVLSRFIDSEREYKFGPYSIIDAFMSNGAPYKPFAEWLPSRSLAEHGISPMRGKNKLNYDVDSFEEPIHGVHWDIKKMYQVLKDKCKSYNNFLYIEDTITHVSGHLPQDKITSVRTNEGVEVLGDYFFDGTGILLNNHLKVKMNSYDFLFNNSVMTFRKEYGDPILECKPVSKMLCQPYGYIMKLPTYENIAYQYCYSDKWDSNITKEQLVNISRVWNKEPTITNFNCGVSEKAVYKNVCGIGQVPGYIDPLLGTNHITTAFLVRSYNKLSIKSINNKFQQMMEEISTFTSLIYQITTTETSDYWKKIKKVKLSKTLKEILSIVKKKPIRNSDLDEIFGTNEDRLFFDYHYFEFMFGNHEDTHATGNCYYHERGMNVNNLPGSLGSNPYNYDEISYMQMGLEKHLWHIAKIIQSFPPHWWYLDCWYNNHDIIWNEKTSDQYELPRNPGGFKNYHMQELPVGLYLDNSKFYNNE